MTTPILDHRAASTSHATPPHPTPPSPPRSLYHSLRDVYSPLLGCVAGSGGQGGGKGGAGLPGVLDGRLQVRARVEGWRGVDVGVGYFIKHIP